MAKKISISLGIIFILFGILGFIPNPLMGDGDVFTTNTLHDIIHLLSGIIFLAVASSSPRTVGVVLKVFSIIYLLAAILGLIQAPGGKIIGIIDINVADNWLHLVFAIIMCLLGWRVAKADSTVGSDMTAPAGQ